MKLLPILVLATASFFIFGKLDSKYLLVEVEGGRGKGVAGTDGTDVAGGDYQDTRCEHCCFTEWPCPPYCDCDSLNKSQKTAGQTGVQGRGRALFKKKKKCKTCKKKCKKGKDCPDWCDTKCDCCKLNKPQTKCKKVKKKGKCKKAPVPWPGSEGPVPEPETTDEPVPEGEGEPDEGDDDDSDY